MSAEQFANRVAVLRAQVRALVPRSPGSSPTDPPAQPERIEALEQLLKDARDREDRLTTQTIHDHAVIAEMQSRIDELEGMRAAGDLSETARAAAESRAADAERRLSLVEVELRSRLDELSRLRSRCEAFEGDLDALAREAAEAVAGAARADRLERERNAARERASTERQLAAQDRERASAAEQQLSDLQEELAAAQRQLATTPALSRRIEAVRESPKAKEPSESTPWLELQHLASATAPPQVEPAEEVEQAPEPEAAIAVEEPATLEETVAADEATAVPEEAAAVPEEAAAQSEDAAASEPAEQEPVVEVPETDAADVVDLTDVETTLQEETPEPAAVTTEPSEAAVARGNGVGLLKRLWSRSRPKQDPETPSSWPP